MKHVIVGAGPAGVLAAETIRSLDKHADIVLVGGEPEPAYSRMAIPYLLAGQIAEEGTWLRHAPDHFDRLGIARRAARVTALRPTDRSVTLDGGTEISYDRLLIASGSVPVDPPVPGLDLPGVHHCWTLADARGIMELARPGARVVLMGAGFIGCIIMEALVARKVRLTVVEAEDRMVPRMMDQTAGGLIKRWCVEQGIEVRTSTRISSVQKSGEGLHLECEPGPSLQADLVVVATGVRPATDFLADSGIGLGKGILVDAHQRSTIEGVFAAGDVCEGVDWDGGHGIHAIQPVAVETGRVAAHNMVGREVAYGGAMDMNVLDTLGLIASSYGRWQGVPDGDTAALLDESAYRYVKLQFQGDRLIGAITLGLTDHIGALRGLIESRRSLGEWKSRLLADPARFMEAWLATLGK